MGDRSMVGDAGSGEPVTHMRLFARPASVTAGTVSFRVHNHGTRTHEVVVLPLGVGERAGWRPVGPDERVDEVGSIGEAPRTCASGAGDGIEEGENGWLTVALSPGRYELVCNLEHHYQAGMFAVLRVR